MDFLTLSQTPQYAYIVLPIIIFFSRIADVTFGTVRVIFVAKGYKVGAAILGFFEVFIWITVIGQIMNNANNIFCYLGYAAGFAAGNYIGIRVENWLSLGLVVIRVITQKDAKELIEYLRSQNYGITVSEAAGSKGKVSIILTVIKRKNLKIVINAINQFNPKAFYSIEDVRAAQEGVFPSANINLVKYPRGFRKGK